VSAVRPFGLPRQGFHAYPFDRRGRTDTALAKLARLRRRVARFKGLRQTLKKLFSPHLEKALTFLDDSLLPATSNAVERANRRHRKMQKTVYRVRTRQTISRRIALDMQRDLQAPARHQTTAFLRQQRRETAQNDSVTLLQSLPFGSFTLYPGGRKPARLFPFAAEGGTRFF